MKAIAFSGYINYDVSTDEKWKDQLSKLHYIQNNAGFFFNDEYKTEDGRIGFAWQFNEETNKKCFEKLVNLENMIEKIYNSELVITKMVK